MGRPIYKPDGHPKPAGFRFENTPVSPGVGLILHPNQFCCGGFSLHPIRTRPVAIPTTEPGAPPMRPHPHIPVHPARLTVHCSLDPALTDPPPPSTRPRATASSIPRLPRCRAPLFAPPRAAPPPVSAPASSTQRLSRRCLCLL
jgi:hypothetical protein